MSKRVNRDDIDKFHDYNLYIPQRLIFIGSEEVSIEHGESGVDASMAERLIKNVTLLDGINGEEITIIMTNPGGDWFHGVGMYDAIEAARSHVKLKVIGMAMSMGAVVLQAADERIISKRSKVMIHYGTMAMPEGTHSKTFDKWSDENKRINKEMEDILLARIREKHPDFQLKKLQKMLNFDTILTAQEAVDLGLADKILGDE